jgi:hypothetical protein
MYPSPSGDSTTATTTHSAPTPTPVLPRAWPSDSSSCTPNAATRSSTSTSDPHLQTASANTFRSYLSITDPGEVADLDSLTEPASLVVLRWPPQHAARTPASIADLFAACRLIMTADTCAIAAVSSAEPGQPGTTYAEHVGELLPAARAAGLTHVLQIVAVTSSGQGDQFLYYATPAEVETARQHWPTGHGSPSYHVDLLVFTNSVRRHE